MYGSVTSMEAIADTHYAQVVKQRINDSHKLVHGSMVMVEHTLSQLGVQLSLSD
jgi:hypothetical protein